MPHQPQEIKEKANCIDNPKLPLDQRVVSAFLGMQITRRDIEQFPAALQYLFFEALEQSRIDPPIGLSATEVCKLLLRPDLLAHANFELNEAIKLRKYLYTG